MTDQEKFLQREIKHRDKKIEELKASHRRLKKALSYITNHCKYIDPHVLATQGLSDYLIINEQALKQAK